MQFVEFELQKENPLYQDEHIRRQSDYYSKEDVDYIVPVEELDDFLIAHGIPILPEKSNVSSLPFTLKDEDMICKIREWYQQDYFK